MRKTHPFCFYREKEDYL
uniref:Uncharacterized protein n=1 Tax=Anguilla anguilla TaxID=7936 RepID=A0A0E9UG59_ANGAN